jgi:glycosyltransferase involved in cell wall biosynthesis
MHIAYLTSQYPAPSHTFIRREIQALRERGLRIDTFSTRRPDEVDSLSAVDRAEYANTSYLLPAEPLSLCWAHLWALLRHPLRYLRALGQTLRHRVPGLRGLLWSLFYFAEATYLARQLRMRGIQHVHNHFANGAANVGMLAARFLNLPWSLTLHGISEFDYPAGIMLAEKLKVAEFVACVSHFGRSQAMRLVAPRYWGKLLVVRCGIELHALPQRREHPGARLRIVCVARMSPEKGLAGLMEAFSRVLLEGIDAELHLIGDGPELLELREQAHRLGLGDRCLMPGRVSEPQALAHIADADVFAMASFMEGLPVVLMEALALRVAVVAPRVAGIPELVEHSVSGLLFNPGDWDDLSQQLLALLNDESLRRRLARNGQERVERDFDVASTVDVLFAQYAARGQGGTPAC